MAILHALLECLDTGDLSVLDILGITDHLDIITHLGTTLFHGPGADSTSSSNCEGTFYGKHEWLGVVHGRDFDALVHMVQEKFDLLLSDGRLSVITGG